jgi:hypothetical protein
MVARAGMHGARREHVQGPPGRRAGPAREARAPLGGAGPRGRARDARGGCDRGGGHGHLGEGTTVGGAEPPPSARREPPGHARGEERGAHREGRGKGEGEREMEGERESSPRGSKIR